LLASRPFNVRVPPRYDAATPAPLLMLLHGYGVTGEVQFAYLRLAPVLDAHGILAVYPDGTKNDLGKRYWKATAACCAPAGSKVDDSAYLSAIIAEVRSEYSVDSRRIYVMGHSNGGFMSFRMACDHADVIAAIVSLEGAANADPEKCKPSHPVAVLAVHGTADQTITYDGGRTTRVGSAPYPGALASVLAWAQLGQCATTPDVPAPPDRDIQQGRPPATVTSFSKECAPGGHSELWTQADGVHIPAWNDTFADQLVGFLLTHPKP